MDDLAFICHTQVILIVPKLSDSLTSKNVCLMVIFLVGCCLMLNVTVKYCYCQVIQLRIFTSILLMIKWIKFSSANCEVYQ